MTGYSAYYPAFAADVLDFLEIRDTAARAADMSALVAWIGGEAGWSGTNIAVRGNNPLNIKAASFRGYGIPVDGVRRITNVDDGTQGYGTFTTRQRGARATARYLSIDAHGYPRAIARLRAADPEGFLDAIARSDWAASHYGLPGRNHLLDNLTYVRAHTPQAPPAPDDPPDTPGRRLNLVPLTTRRQVALRAGTILRRPDGEPFTRLAQDVTLGLIAATGTHYLVADGDDGVFVRRAEAGAITTADRNVGA